MRRRSPPLRPHQQYGLGLLLLCGSHLEVLQRQSHLFSIKDLAGVELADAWHAIAMEPPASQPLKLHDLAQLSRIKDQLLAHFVEVEGLESAKGQLALVFHLHSVESQLEVLCDDTHSFILHGFNFQF